MGCRLYVKGNGGGRGEVWGVEAREGGHRKKRSESGWQVWSFR